MRVGDVLKSNRQSLATCIPEDSITSICTRLSALNIGAFPVCDARGTLVGILSERDVVRAFARDGARLADMHVRDLMTQEVVTCATDTTMVEAEKIMGLNSSAIEGVLGYTEGPTLIHADDLALTARRAGA